MKFKQKKLITRNRYILFAWLLLFLTNTACRKDRTTTITATIVNAKTGEPIAGAAIEYGLIEKDKDDDAGEDFRTIAKANHVGVCKISYDANEYRWYSNHIYKDGYIRTLRKENIVEGQENLITVELVERDATLKLIIENELGIYENLGISATSNSFEFYQAIILYSAPTIGLGDSIIQYRSMVSDEDVTIEWGTENAGNSNYYILDRVAYAGSVSSGDTLIYSLKF
jgi:hypothetical protein